MYWQSLWPEPRDWNSVAGFFVERLLSERTRDRNFLITFMTWRCADASNLKDL
jgi:hypothetical protein